MTLDSIIIFLDKYNLPWVLLAILVWIVIVFTCSMKEFVHALPVGIWTMFVGYILETFFVDHRFWVDKFLMIPIGDLDLFLVIGPFFAIGLLLIRFLPRERWKKLFLILLFSALATAIEALAMQLGFLQYADEKWCYIHSFVAYIFGLFSAVGFYSIYYDKRPNKLGK